MGERNRLRAAIAAIEAQRARLGDAAELALASLHAQLAALKVEQSLRQASVLFVDVVGSTALINGLTPEDAHQAMDPALAEFTAIVRRQEGRVLQYAGDSLLAAFGVECVREDDALRAVRAALAILAAAQRHAAHLRRRYQREFAVRAGIHTGPVLLGAGVDGEASLRGLTVHLAARMEQTAPAGRLRISRATWKLVQHAFVAEPQPLLVIKGEAAALETYLVGRERVAGERGMVRVVTPCFGRESELAELCEAWSRARCGGAPTRLVTGEAGIGKSRLLAEFVAQLAPAEAGPTVFSLPCDASRTPLAHGLLSSLLEQGAGLTAAMSAAQCQASLAQILASAWGDRAGECSALLARLIGRLPAGRESDARELRDRGFHIASQWLARRGSETGLVLLIDDLQWAEASDFDFLSRLLDSAESGSLLIVATARSEALERLPEAWRLAPRQELAPLQAEAQTRLACALLGGAGLPASLANCLQRRAGGNPLFVEALLDHWMTQTDLGAAAELKPASLEGIPATLGGLLQARLDALMPAHKSAAQWASVIGPVFDRSALAAIDAAAPEALASLVSRGVLRALDGSSAAGGERYAFSHQLLQQTAYESLLRAARCRAHRRHAQWLTRARAGPAPARIAWHFEQAGESVAALPWWTAAARTAVERYAHPAACEALEHALALSPDDRGRWDLLLLRETLLGRQADRGPWGDCLAELEQLAEALDDDACRARVASLRADYWGQAGDSAAAIEFARRALAHAPRAEAALTAWPLKILAYELERLGRHAEALEYAERGLVVARSASDKRTEAALLNQLGIAALAAGDPGAAATHFAAAVALHEALGHRHNEGGSRSNLGYVELVLGDWAQARRQFQHALAICEEVGQTTSIGLIELNLALADLGEERAESARSHARGALARLQSGGDRSALAAAYRILGDAEIACGEIGAACGDLARSRDLYTELAQPGAALEAMAGLALAHQAAGRLDEANEIVGQVWSALAAGVDLAAAEQPLRILLICHQVLAARGDRRADTVLVQARRELLDRAARITDPQRRAGFLRRVPWHRQILAAAGAA